jgi:hypothetical protein
VRGFWESRWRDLQRVATRWLGKLSGKARQGMTLPPRTDSCWTAGSGSTSRLPANLDLVPIYKSRWGHHRPKTPWNQAFDQPFHRSGRSKSKAAVPVAVLGCEGDLFGQELVQNLPGHRHLTAEYLAPLVDRSDQPLLRLLVKDDWGRVQRVQLTREARFATTRSCRASFATIIRNSYTRIRIPRALVPDGRIRTSVVTSGRPLLSD